MRYFCCLARAHLAVEDYDRVIEEFERAKALYGTSEEILFHTYLAEAAKGIYTRRFFLVQTLLLQGFVGVCPYGYWLIICYRKFLCLCCSGLPGKTPSLD